MAYKIILLYRKVIYTHIYIYTFAREKVFAANFFRSSEAFVERNVVGGSGSGKPRRENSQHALLFTDIEIRHRPRTVSIRARFHASLSCNVLGRSRGAFVKKKKNFLFPNRLFPIINYGTCVNLSIN